MGPVGDWRTFISHIIHYAVPTFWPISAVKPGPNPVCPGLGQAEFAGCHMCVYVSNVNPARSVRLVRGQLIPSDSDWLTDSPWPGKFWLSNSKSFGPFPSSLDFLLFFFGRDTLNLIVFYLFLYPITTRPTTQIKKIFPWILTLNGFYRALMIFTHEHNF